MRWESLINTDPKNKGEWVDQKQKSSSNRRDREISELKAELKRTDRILERQKFLVIATAVAAIFVIVGLAVTRVKTQATRQTTQPPEQINLSQELVYKCIPYSDFQKSQELQEIVNEVVKLAEKRNLPTDVLSISLIEVNSEKKCWLSRRKT